MAILGGTATIGGNMADDLRDQVNALITQFEELVSQQATAKRLRRAVVRSQLVCNSVLLLDRSHLWIVAEPARGLPARLYFDRPNLEAGVNDARAIGVWDFGYQDPFVLVTCPHCLVQEL